MVLTPRKVSLDSHLSPIVPLKLLSSSCDNSLVMEGGNNEKTLRFSRSPAMGCRARTHLQRCLWQNAFPFLLAVFRHSLHLPLISSIRNDCFQMVRHKDLSLGMDSSHSTMIGWLVRYTWIKAFLDYSSVGVERWEGFGHVKNSNLPEWCQFSQFSLLTASQIFIIFEW